MHDQAEPAQARFAVARAVSRALTRPLDLTDLLRVVTRELSRAVDTTICFFGLYDAATQWVEVVWQVHDGVELPGGRFPLGSGFTSQVIRERQPRLIRDWSVEGPPVQLQYATDRAGLPQSSITVPVLYDERVLGVLGIQSYRPGAYDANDLELVQCIADQVASALAAEEHRSGRIGRLEPPADLEPVLANLADGVLVLDSHLRIVQLNASARSLLSLREDGLILGYPADRPQDGQWPLGSQTVTQAIMPLLQALMRGESPPQAVLVQAGTTHFTCSGSLLLRDGVPIGGVLMFRDLAVTR